ncbi:hypothetical protein CARUB_v10016809mg [Capsella rubella]|uniref:Protein kinase domain-containing protein n=1 Tax=Capsella rubella TaxID=81985 RepID=R0HDQ4_9BRAS|nr:hypothetical protein CARUB_v10016809mg [Capsella rubella]
METLSSMGSQTTRFCRILLFLFYYLPCALNQLDSIWLCNDLFQCGNITAGFPFSGGLRDETCGHPSLKLNCNKVSNTTSLIISGYNYTVLHIDYNNDNKSLTLGLSRQDFSVKGLGSVVQNSTYRKLCDESFSVIVPTSYVPEEEVLDLAHLESVLREGFEVKLKMNKMNCAPECLPSSTNCSFLSGDCCTYTSGTLTCGTTGNLFREMIPSTRSILIKIAEVIGPNVVIFVVMVIAFLIWRRKKAKALRDHNLEALVTSRRYSYKEIKKITKSFTEVVGRGGFGTVYKGSLRNGRKVAVKILKDSKGNCKEFINEVASMSQTSHVNIVSLLGFCYDEGSKRAIVYEFLENGSLDNSLGLGVSTLYEIALGVARGLEYLHYGCKKRIVHFDIKPQNVLLDENLRPKVADFGLAKLWEKQESILSLLDTRGTMGYIAPELFSRMYGNVSHKSDVYSYGMLVLEMIGERNKERVENADSNHSSAYFPDWIYKDLDNGDYLKLYGDELTQEEGDLVKKMILVGLWCIQFCPSDRPSMNRVVEMMEGSLDSLNPPPKPLLHMPMQSIAESSQLSDIAESSQLSDIAESSQLSDIAESSQPSKESSIYSEV